VTTRGFGEALPTWQKGLIIDLATDDDFDFDDLEC
jgi:hypothetical protein